MIWHVSGTETGGSDGTKAVVWLHPQAAFRALRSRYTGPDLLTHVAPETFTSKIDAEAWLAAERRLSEDPSRWQAPKARLDAEYQQRARQKRQTFESYARDWLSTGTWPLGAWVSNTPVGIRC